MKAVGMLVTGIGIFLWCGNVFGFFRTIPFAGYGTILLGGYLAKMGDK